MAGCNSDPSEGCDNSAIVAAIGACCVQTTGILTSINANLTAIKANDIACCALINTKLDTANGLLQQILDK